MLAFLIQAQASPGAPASNPLMSFLPLIFIVAIFYFLVFMPMQRQKKTQATAKRDLDLAEARLKELTRSKS